MKVSFALPVLFRWFKSPTEPEPRLYVHIWQKQSPNIQRKSCQSRGGRPWWQWLQIVIIHLFGQNNHRPPHHRYYHQSCQRYNYYTVFYIQQVINKLKVISAICVVKEQVSTLTEAEPYLHRNPIGTPLRVKQKKRHKLKTWNYNPRSFFSSKVNLRLSQ